MFHFSHQMKMLWFLRTHRGLFMEMFASVWPVLPHPTEQTPFTLAPRKSLPVRFPSSLSSFFSSLQVENIDWWLCTLGVGGKPPEPVCMCKPLWPQTSQRTGVKHSRKHGVDSARPKASLAGLSHLRTLHHSDCEALEQMRLGVLSRREDICIDIQEIQGGILRGQSGHVWYTKT